MERCSGILMPVSALPSPGGIGTLGREAYQFCDFLERAGQRVWQMLPLGPTSYGDSPYQSFSTYAGNPYFVDPELLMEEGLVTREEIDSFPWGDDSARINYGAIYQSRFTLLRLAFRRGMERELAPFHRFREENARWLEDYALFMALKNHFGMRAWTQWEDEAIRLHQGEALTRYRELLREDVEFYSFVQYLFFRQWDALKAYAHRHGIRVMGDMPIYVAMDSADVWAGPENFLLDERNAPIAVAGVPPDYFSATGQLWGNPLYRWDKMAENGYRWWIDRVKGASRLYDALRIDHFRGFESYWKVPAGAETAITGEWVKGPGMALISAIQSACPDVEIIAEDLGFLSDGVRALLADSGFPGMKVLEFAFDSREPSNYLPHTYPRHCVCYVGTHDNSTVAAWRQEAAPEDVRMAVEYLGLNQEEGFHWGMIRGGMSSVANLFVAQMQDYLGLGAEARMNIPGTLGGNWAWRLLPGQLSEALAARIRRMAWMYGRLAGENNPE